MDGRGEGAGYAVTVEALTALVRAAVSAGYSERLPSHEMDRPATRERVPMRVRRGKNAYLFRDRTDSC